jgi:uncharacterized protein (DUF3820 family)
MWFLIGSNLKSENKQTSIFYTLFSILYILKKMTNQEQLIKLAYTIMPYGKFKGRYLINLPEQYIVWYKNKGFPAGTLGEQLKLVYELKLNGLEELIHTIQKKYPKP